jgi:non-heme chloroperoxidase
LSFKGSTNICCVDSAAAIQVQYEPNQFRKSGDKVPYINVGKENSHSVELYYEDHGEGKPVVLIHGWPLSGASWERQVSVLVDAGYRVITYDRRGFGKSSQPFLGYDYDTLAADLHALILELDLHDVALIGFSMGGGEVARYVGKYGTSRVKKAGFVSAVTPFLLKAPDNPEGLDKNIFDGLQKACLKDRPAFIAKFLEGFFNFDSLKGTLISNEAIQANFIVAMGASPKATHDCIGSWLTDFRADLRRFDIPTIVIHGAADQTAPIAATGTRMSGFVKGAKLVTIEKGPHGLNWTHAEQFNQALLSFLQ